VLVPYVAALFKLLIAEAKVPRSWKEARLTPIYKQGPVTQPGNYRMIAISGMLYRLYANLLRSMIQGWCIQHNKVPGRQCGFYPGRSIFATHFHSTTLKACCEENAKPFITVVCCVY